MQPLFAVPLLFAICGVIQISAEPQGKSTAANGFIRVSKDKHGFVFADSGAPFKPWGFNYDHDASNRLLETYWKAEWDAVAEDFREMKTLGANTVRIHLQVSRFMKS